LNSDKRTVMVPDDVTSAAEILVVDEEAHFGTSWFSPQNLSPEERTAAITFAHGLPDGADGLPEDVATGLVGAETLRVLEEKHVLAVRDDMIEIKGRLLTDYLRRRIAERPTVTLPPQEGPHTKVGVFVDLENSLATRPSGMTIEEFGRAINAYASSFGNVVCHWACAASWNLDYFGGATSVQIGMERAGFQIAFVRDALKKMGVSKENIADFEMLERMNDERTNSAPDLFLIVAGDQDYYTRASNLLDSGFGVRVASSNDSLASVYNNLVLEREELCLVNGKPEGDFKVDDLVEVLARSVGGE
jgi:hypothetical protein